MWAKVQSGAIVAYPYGPSELRRDFPNTSFPGAMSQDALAAWDVVPVEPRNPPAHDYITQNCERVLPTLSGNSWVETWAVTAASEAEVEQRNADLRQGLSLSFSQLLIGLVAEGWITEPDGEAWLSGTLPGAVLAVISTLPAEQQFAAKARALRPSVVVRSDPLVGGLAAVEGKSPDQIDDFFTTHAVV